MLDLDAIFAAAADQIGGKQGNTQNPSGKHPCFPSETQHSCGFPGVFSHRETRETGFAGGAGCECDAHPKNSLDDTRTPAPPDLVPSRDKPREGVNAVSLVSHERDSEYLRGFQGDFSGKQPCFPLFPVFPDDELEARIERAAILEFDAGLTRADADAAAGLIERYCKSLPPAGAKRRGYPLGRNPRA